LSEQLKQRLSQLTESSSIGCLADIGHGIEKESLRINPQGHIAQTPHPAGLGSPLTHPSLTTDFSEALLEFITPVFQSPDESLAYLSNLHAFTFRQMDREELIWTSSMPCVLDDDSQIPLAEYGSSNIGKLKTLYRMGLSYRYGRAMQTIAGIHYNFSLPDSFWDMYKDLHHSELSLTDFKTEQYFNLIRNFRRYSWLLIYLFGASPAVCKSFVRNNKDHGLESYDDATLYMPYATCLRMGDLGYTSDAQSDLYVSYNDLENYALDLTNAIRTIRPKRVAPTGTRPLKVLRDQGVEYIEVRCLDLNPFLPVGIDSEQIKFLNSFLMLCLLRKSPPSNAEEYAEIEDNLKTVVNRGREPGLELKQQGKSIALKDWADEILQEALSISELMDDIHQDETHSQATKAQLAKVKDSTLTPSAKILQRMDELKTPYFTFAMNQSLANSDFFRSQTLDSEVMTNLKEMAEKSNLERQAIESSDNIDFETYVKQMNAS